MSRAKYPLLYPRPLTPDQSAEQVVADAWIDIENALRFFQYMISSARRAHDRQHLEGVIHDSSICETMSGLETMMDSGRQAFDILLAHYKQDEHVLAAFNAEEIIRDLATEDQQRALIDELISDTEIDDKDIKKRFH